MFSGLKNKIVNIWNTNTPSDIPASSQFFEKGILTPTEFVQAGERLILANPIWTWKKSEAGETEEKSLPPNKQFLSARIISRSRASELDKEINTCEQQKNGWTAINLDKNIESLSLENKEKDDEEIMDLEDVLDSDEEISNNKNKDKKEDKNIRHYTVNITYDRHYLTPRFWLSGVDYKNSPLTKEEIYEEIMGEYKDKTVTFDKQPHISSSMANIHPCRHAEVIRTLVNQAINNGRDINPDQCLFLFLKFISSVMPNLEIDFTTDFEI